MSNVSHIFKALDQNRSLIRSKFCIRRNCTTIKVHTRAHHTSLKQMKNWLTNIHTDTHFIDRFLKHTTLSLETRNMNNEKKQQFNEIIRENQFNYFKIF